ncbi:uncharacterized protein LOC115806344 [Chanos chanos]|uniref:Uncharacterized protein LOC115806344 n=1 Tax=Chanos chanos TaxID=29144 RepID=A0A6J2US38_CHACN|nr:uncharacterized protein LOC115806344 [Chanos chanos]
MSHGGQSERMGTGPELGKVRSSGLQRQTLVEVTGDLEQRLCQQHHRVLEVFCKTDQTDICKVCAVEEHKGHTKVYREISRVPDTPSLLRTALAKMKIADFEIFKKELNRNYPDCLGSRPEDLDVCGVADKMLESFDEQAAQRIVMHVLNADFPVRKVTEENKAKLRQKFQHISEGISRKGTEILLNEIYTELYITEGGSGEVSDEHEVRQIEMTSKRQTSQETPIKCNDIFKTHLEHGGKIRTVLTKGTAGIGKTVSVLKFILDWAEGKANQDITVIVPLPFRDLNLKKENYSLIQILHHYAPELKGSKCIEDGVKLLFIFDGLDECRLPLDFQNNEVCCDVTKSISVDVLLTNLIKGNLLPSALLWITSRPAAANQIPPECIHQVTEIRGFSDRQKEEYFRKRISDQNLANRVITHIKSSRSLYIMCLIPVFCWISATVFENMMGDAGNTEIPKTLTEIYTHFLFIQISLKNKKYHEATLRKPKNLSKSDKEMILKLGELAFQQLEKGNLIFYEEDLSKCGIDVNEASEYFSVCPEIFREELGLYREKVFCFGHLSIQEHLAAVYAHVTCVNESKDVFNSMTTTHYGSSLLNLHKSVVDKALQSKNGHLDLFLRFLLGLSLEPIQTLLQDLIRKYSSEMRTYNTAESIQYIMTKIREESSPERITNLFHCLHELNYNSLVREIQTAFRSGTLSDKDIKPDQCSALAYMLLMTEEVLDEFDLKMYKTSAAGQQRLLPVLRTCKRARLAICNLSPESCGSVATALQSVNSPLRELNLSCNTLTDSGVKLLCAGLMSPHCNLQKLEMVGCNLSWKSCESLASVLRSVNSPLKKLDLSYNNLTDSGVKLLCTGLTSPNCKLEILGLSSCGLTDGCCSDLASVLQPPHSNLRELELRDNDLQDSGVKLLSAGLKNPHCYVHTLGLSGCLITEEGCASLASALRSNPSNLRELDLSYNHPGGSGVKLLHGVLEDPLCKLEKLELDHSGECRTNPGLRKYAFQLTLDQNTAHKLLSLSKDNRTVMHTSVESPYPDHPDRFKVHPHILCREALTERCYWEVEWSGIRVLLGVTYKSIDKENVCMGMDSKSFMLKCQSDGFAFWHNGMEIVTPYFYCTRIGVYLDWAAGTLSFYSIFNGTLTLLYTFHTAFTEPVYAGFGVYPHASVTLCHELTESELTEDLLQCDGADPWMKVKEVTKEKLMQHFKYLKYVNEGCSNEGKSTLLNEIYTELYITEVGSIEVYNEHEVKRTEMFSVTQSTQEKVEKETEEEEEEEESPIKLSDIFKTLPEEREHIRTVLTQGVAGIGKTVSVQKFILDWAEGKANQDITVIVPLPFRDLNLKKENYSLTQLLHHYAPELKEIKDIEDEKVKLLLIFDGLDECRFPLDFQNNEVCRDVTKSISVDVLLTNLIKGNLLPSALLWITSRPAAANQIPPEYVHRVTEICGFSDPKKEEYFRKRISGHDLANRIITHIKSSRSLHIMSHLPVFCWLSATVFQNMMSDENAGEIPKTLTEMYAQFLYIPISLKNKRLHGDIVETSEELVESDIEMILKLGELAFQQLERGNLIFYEEDLRECGIDVSEASEYSSVCPEIFREELGLYKDKVFCFVHLSIQEHLAAVYALDMCLSNQTNVFNPEEGGTFTLSNLHQSAVDNALHSNNGHLDLFLRLLLGMSLKFSPEGRKCCTETAEYITEMIKEETLQPERIINLFHCLDELNDNPLVQEIQTSLRSGTLSDRELEPHQCSALAYMLLMSEEVLDEFDLKMYKTSAAGQQMLLQVLRICKRARLNDCTLSSESCVTVAKALQSVNSPLRELDLSFNSLGDEGFNLLCTGLKNSNCKLQKLWLAGCDLSSESCGIIVSVLQSVNSPLRELDLSFNSLEDEGFSLLCTGLRNSNCKLQKLWLTMCGLTENCGTDLSSVLRSPHCNLRELELRDNDLQDPGVELLCSGLGHPHCKLEKLGLSGCLISEEGCASLASALRLNPSQLKELDLSYNHPGDSGVSLFSTLLEDPHYKLEKLELDHSGEHRMKPGPRKYACQLRLDRNTAHRYLSLSEDNRRVTGTSVALPHPIHYERFKCDYQVLCREVLTERCYWEVEFSGERVQIGVTYRSINRTKGLMGRNAKSFSMEWRNNRFFFWHNDERSAVLSPSHPSTRIGVYLDWAAGTLFFYSIFNDTLTPLHRFYTTFTEPLYAGFGVYPDCTLSLCQLE